MPLHRCQAFKNDGTQCTHDAWRHGRDTHPEHLHLCGVHKNTYANKVEQTGGLHHVAGHCFETVSDPRNRGVRWWCQGVPAPGQHFCAQHADAHTRREAAVRQERDANLIFHAFLDQNPRAGWRDVTLIVREMGEFTLAQRRNIARRYYHVMMGGGAPEWQFDVYWAWVVGGRQGPAPAEVPMPPPPPPPPRRELEVLAADNQNVHTRPVTEQTNKATEKLLGIKVPETQETQKTLTLVWLGGLHISYYRYLQVANDMHKWFNTKDCRAVNDNLYRRLLRGLVALIVSEKDEERKGEMYRRCWEECFEAVGMCCEGHISRLCNVLVGFDEAFQPPVPFGEILQNKMAAIAGLDIPEEEKRKQANAFFDEHRVAQEERSAWLDAF